MQRVKISVGAPVDVKVRYNQANILGDTHMSGHSKWNNIKNKKGKEDAKKGKAFGLVGRMIRVAVKEGNSGDAAMNPSLRLALEKAKEVNMPHANIERAIEKGLGRSKTGIVIEEVVYEGYGASGVGFMVTAVTDNRNRTGAEVRTCFERHGGSLGGPGSAGYLFNIAPDGSATVKIPLDITDSGVRAQVLDLMTSLEELDDVEQVTHNMVEGV